MPLDSRKWLLLRKQTDQALLSFELLLEVVK